MKAFQIVAPGVAELREVTGPEPAPGEVLIRVGAAGACHSDVHMIDQPRPEQLPLTLGHEIAGWVDTLGPGTTGFDVGEPVAVYGVTGCGHCARCLVGQDNACQVLVGGIGLNRPGGMAPLVSVPARSLVPIGDLDPLQAAPLTDAGLSAYHAVQLSRQVLGPGSTCVVLGIGGLGHMAVQILRVTTNACIIAVDVSADARALANRLGADHTVDSHDADTAVAAVREVVGPSPGGADVVLDFVGITATLEIGRRVVATGGHLTLVGLGGGTLPLTPGGQAVPFETRITTPFWGTRPELREVLALAAAGRLAAEIQTFCLSDAGRAYDRMRAGTIHGRGVVLPQR